MNHIRIEDLIVIDIETASCFPAFTDMDLTWQELWKEKTSKSLPENISAEEFYPMRAGVMAEFSKIVCISIGYFIKEPHLKMRVKSFCCDDEKKILADFLQTVTKIESFNNRWCFAGHNIKEFDIPFICRRLLIQLFLHDLPCVGRGFGQDLVRPRSFAWRMIGAHGRRCSQLDDEPAARQIREQWKGRMSEQGCRTADMRTEHEDRTQAPSREVWPVHFKKCAHGPGAFSNATSATFRNPADRRLSITSINVP